MQIYYYFVAQSSTCVFVVHVFMLAIRLAASQCTENSIVHASEFRRVLTYEKFNIQIHTQREHVEIFFTFQFRNATGRCR